MTELEHIGELTTDTENARAHNPRNVGMIVNALQEIGAARSIVIDEDGRILAGNATIEAAALAGIERVKVVEADGETIIAVRRSGLTDEQKKRLALYDNRTAELADWDAGQLAADLEAGFDLSGLWSEGELAGLLEGQDIDYDELWQGMPEFDQDDLGAFQTIKVHFADRSAIEAFAELVEQTITEKTKYIWYPKKERMDLKAVVCKDES